MTLSIITRGTSRKPFNTLSLLVLACALACSHSVLADVKWGRASTPIEGNPPQALEGSVITLSFPEGTGILNPDPNAKLYIDSSLRPRDFSLNVGNIIYGDKDGDEREGTDTSAVATPAWIDPKTGKPIPADSNLEAFDDIYVMDGKKVWASPGPAIVSRPLNVAPAGAIKLLSKTGNPKEGITNVESEGGYTLYPVRPGLDINGIRVRFEEMEGKQFPYNGFDGAYFFMVTILPPDQYNWTLEAGGSVVSDPKNGDPFVSLDPATGSITLVKSPGGIRNYKVTAKPKTGKGPEFKHEWAVKRWFTDYASLGEINRGRAFAKCRSEGKYIPWMDEISTAVKNKPGTRSSLNEPIPTPKDSWGRKGRTIYPDENHPDKNTTPLVAEWGQLGYEYGWSKGFYHIAEVYPRMEPISFNNPWWHSFPGFANLVDGNLRVGAPISIRANTVCIDYLDVSEKLKGYIPKLTNKIFTARTFPDIDVFNGMTLAPKVEESNNKPSVNTTIFAVTLEEQDGNYFDVTPMYSEFIRFEFFEDNSTTPLFSVGYLGNIQSNNLSTDLWNELKLQNRNDSSINPELRGLAGEQGLRIEAVIDIPNDI